MRFATIPGLICALLCFTCTASAQESGHYTCYRTDDRIVADGRLDEEDWALAEWSGDFIDITGDPGLKPPLRTRIKLLWDSENIYVAAELREPHVWATLTKRDEVIFHDNDFEIFIDPDGNGLNYYEIEINALGTVWDLMLTRAYKDQGIPVSSWDLEGMSTGIHVNGSLNDPSRIDTSWTLEAALPVAELMKGKLPGSQPAEGVQWRVNFSRVEWETEARGSTYKKKSDPATGMVLPERNWVWSPMGEVAMHIPERWGRLEFSAAHAGVGPLRFRDEAQRENFKIWLWMGGYSDWNEEKWDSLLAGFHAAGIHGILTQADPSALSRIVPLAQKHGIAVEKWFVAMMNNDTTLINQHPSWFVINREGRSSVTHPPYVGYYRFLCPSNPEVRRYLGTRLEEYLQIPGLAGIHLDYIRYPDVILPRALWAKYGIVQDAELPPYDYCYCTVCREKFLKEFGSDPMLPDHPDSNMAWRQFRYDQVTSLVKELAEQCHSAGKKLSAAVFPGPAIAKQLVRQQWEKWPVDEVFPMLYQDFYFESLDWIRIETAEGTRSVGPSVPLCSGLYIPSLNPRELQSAIGKSVEGGASGICLFSYEAMTPGHWQALSKVLGR